MYSTETRIILSIVSQYIIWTCIRYHMNQEFIGCGQHLLMLHLPNIYLYLNNVFPLSVLSQLTFLVCFFFLVMVMSDDVSKRQESSRVHVVAVVDDVVMVLLSVCPAGSIKSSQMFEQLTSALVTTCCRTRFLIIFKQDITLLTHLHTLLHCYIYLDMDM